MASLDAFGNRMTVIADRLTVNIQGLIADIGTEIGVSLVPATPVKTGFARGNWRPTLNAPSPLPVTILDPTGSATIARIRVISHQYRLGNTLFITNRTPYIGLLNQGSSPQAPPGFVLQAVTQGLERGKARHRGGLLR